jgi:hypothetical protein
MDAKRLEEAYQHYRNVREIALSVYAKKLEEYEAPDYEDVCLAILFEYDHHNQRKIAEKIGISSTQLLKDLVMLSTGARLLRQGK